MNLQEAFKNDNRYNFYKRLDEMFEQNGNIIKFGYNYGYCWEEWTVRSADSCEKSPNKKIIIDFYIGLKSGWIKDNNHTEAILYETLRQIIIHKQFENEDINLIDVLEEVTGRYK